MLKIEWSMKGFVVYSASKHHGFLMDKYIVSFCWGHGSCMCTFFRSAHTQEKYRLYKILNHGY